jgi:hypothetical protein
MRILTHWMLLPLPSMPGVPTLMIRRSRALSAPLGLSWEETDLSARLRPAGLMVELAVNSNFNLLSDIMEFKHFI